MVASLYVNNWAVLLCLDELTVFTSTVTIIQIDYNYGLRIKLNIIQIVLSVVYMLLQIQLENTLKAGNEITFWIKYEFSKSQNVNIQVNFAI